MKFALLLRFFSDYGFRDESIGMAVFNPINNVMQCQFSWGSSNWVNGNNDGKKLIRGFNNDIKKR